MHAGSTHAHAQPLSLFAWDGAGNFTSGNIDFRAI